ncbi:general substrate transporter [Aspergillus cavernicola]|uniref:General substrate transporter n=1 Tax=Aspergillus cavernicola TaxID=176166 RepID=A0ABR4IQW5_9EURO
MDIDKDRAAFAFAFDLEQARRGTEQEHSLSFTQGLKTYRKAVGWSMLFSLAIIMEGYDTTLLQSFFAFPVFVQRYGAPVYYSSGPRAGEVQRYELSAAWQSGLSNGAHVGEIIGLFITGLVSERIGYRRIMGCATLSLAAFICVLFFAPDLPTLLVGEILCGVPWGVFQTVTTAYAAEVCPVALRGYLTTYVNLCWVIGQFIATGVLRGFLHRADVWSYRIPFALQWVWLPFILASVWFGPESPWWLVRRGRIDEARRVLDRLHSSSSSSSSSSIQKEEKELDNTLAMMLYTSEIESNLKARQSTSSFTDCFRGTDRRRTEITCITWAIQALCGSSFMGYSTYFYQQAGLDASQSFNMSLGQYGFGVVGTLFSWVLMARFGRRGLYVFGLFALTVILFSVGFVSLSTSSVASWVIGSLLLLFTFTYDCTIGPVCYSIVAEIPSTQMRAKTIVLARNVYNMLMIVNGVIVPRMLNPTAWDWKGRAGFFWGGVTVVLFVWAFFRLPESKGRTFAEMDLLFERGVKARRFGGVDVFIGNVQTQGRDG